jgi:glycosyltransferase involved in cell wall biosynthesis
MNMLSRIKWNLRKLIKYYYFYFKYRKYINFKVNKELVDVEKSILIISHEMSRTGAPVLLLHIVKELNRLGWTVNVVTMSAGPLLEDFNRFSTVYVSRTASSFIKKLQLMKCHGVNRAIVNTVVSGGWCTILNKMDFNIVTLVHELPGVIITWDAIDSAKAIVEKSNVIVFPSTFVRDKFKEFIGHTGNYKILPQGLFLKVDKPPERELAKDYIKLKFKLDNKPVVLNVASGSYRKGFDLFVDMAVKEPKLNFIWVGDIDKDTYAKISNKINLDAVLNLHLLGYVSELELLLNLYAGADVLALTSREEPFGSIVLESMSAGTPVIGFRGAGGFQDIVKCNETGFLVAFEDVNEMLSKIDLIVNDQKLAKKLQRNTKEIIKLFSFETYVSNILATIKNK